MGQWNRRVVVGYVAAGVVLGGLWLAHRGQSPWEHAIRLLGLMAVVMAVSTAARHFAARAGKQVRSHAIGRFLLLKVALVALAVGAGLVLGERIPNADMWIGVGMGVTVAVVGPMVHPWLMRGQHDGTPA